MANIRTRINKETKKNEIVITDFTDLDDLVKSINDEKAKEQDLEVGYIFISKSLNFEGRSIEGCDFSDCVFEEEVYFNSIDFKYGVYFKYCIFKKDVSFCNCTFTEEAVFSSSIFEQDVNFINSTFDSINSTSFHRTTFKKKCDFQNSKFKTSVDFWNTTFSDYVNFYKVEFNEKQQFFQTDFLDRAIFDFAKFMKEAQFVYCKVKPDTFISFRGAEFHKAIDISRSNFNFTNVIYWDIVIKNDDNNIRNALKSESYTNDFGEKEILPSVAKKIRESFRMIKNALLTDNNKIESLEFGKLELEVYEEEDINDFDRVILWLNKISNNHSTGWVRGIIFTIGVGLLVFGGLSCAAGVSFSCDKEGCENFLTNFIKVLNILDFKPFEEEIIPNKKVCQSNNNDNNIFKNKNEWFYLILFIGRIFIGYGYYQTVQAFRKYGKSE